MKQLMVDRARRLRVVAAVSLPLMLAAAGCGGHDNPAASGPTSAAGPVISTPAAPAASAPAGGPATAAPVAPAAAGGPASGAPNSVAPSPAATTAEPGAGPAAGGHFNTPQAAVGDLAAACNGTDVRAVRDV